MIEGRRIEGEAVVTIDGDPIDWQGSLEIRDHSPTGVEWGYEGRGAAQLALASLLELTGDERLACEYYQQLKLEVLAKIKADAWRTAWSAGPECGKSPATVPRRRPPAGEGVQGEAPAAPRKVEVKRVGFRGGPVKPGPVASAAARAARRWRREREPR